MGRNGCSPALHHWGSAPAEQCHPLAPPAHAQPTDAILPPSPALLFRLTASPLLPGTAATAATVAAPLM